MTDANWATADAPASSPTAASALVLSATAPMLDATAVAALGAAPVVIAGTGVPCAACPDVDGPDPFADCGEALDGEDAAPCDDPELVPPLWDVPPPCAGCDEAVLAEFCDEPDPWLLL